MITFLQTISLIAGLLLDSEYAKYIPIFIPAIYSIVMVPPALFGPKDISKDQILMALKANWINADELTNYLIKNWVSFEYYLSARKRQRNSIFLAINSIGISIWYFTLGKFLFAAVALLCGLFLWMLSMRAFGPQMLFYHSRDALLSKNELIVQKWIMAAMSMVAISELFPSHVGFKLMRDDVLSDNFAKSAINSFRYQKL